MDREIVLASLILAIVGPALPAVTAWRQRPQATPSALHWERACWRALWMPVLIGLIMVSALLGWAMLEPRDSEPLPLLILAVSALFAAIWTRALIRGVKAARRRPEVVAATVGLWRPHSVVSDGLVTRLDGAAVEAVRAHEEAHIRHRDPLRLWLAQLATDLQWPSRNARQRFDQWRHVLELARDEEARQCGVDGADLAAAILVAVRLTPTSPIAAGLISSPAALEDRVARLLAPLATHQPEDSASSVLAVLSACLLSAASGARFGEALMQAIIRILS